MSKEEIIPPSEDNAPITFDISSADDSDPQFEMNADFYSDQGYIYNYDRYPKLPEHLKEYFSLPIVKKFLRQQRRGATITHRLAELFKIPFIKNQPSNSRNVLDLGSGIGVESSILRRLLPKSKVISIDISNTGTKRGKEQFDLNQVQGDINLPPFANESFAGIHCKDVFVHVEDKERFFANVARMLVEGGTFLLVSAENAYPDIGQFNWQMNDAIEVAKRHGLKLIGQNQHKFKNDDWYNTQPHKRAYLLFQKVAKTEEK